MYTEASLPLFNERITWLMTPSSISGSRPFGFFMQCKTTAAGAESIAALAKEYVQRANRRAARMV
jgi:hypothetical protein